MHAIRAIEFGPPDVLVPSELPEPAAGPGQVVVGVKFAPVLFLDTQIRAGWGRDWFPVTPPYTPGAGVAGEITSVGPGVDPEWLGRRVVADTAENGGYLERAAVKADRVVAIPEALGTAEAAARGGRFSAHGAPSGRFAPIDRQEAERRTITVRGIEQVQFAPADARRLTGRALSEAAAARIRPVIGQRYPLACAADAHRAVEARDVIGKTLLEI